MSSMERGSISKHDQDRMCVLRMKVASRLHLSRDSDSNFWVSKRAFLTVIEVEYQLMALQALSLD